MKDKKLSVIVPVFRGEKFIAKNLEKMKNSISKYFPINEIIVVIDGHSIDNSLSEAKKVEGVKVLSYETNQGKGHALKYGFEHSTGDFITFVDADLDIDIENLKNFLPYLSTADLVIGSKRHPFSKVKYPLKRKILSKGFQIYSWLILQVHLRDTQSGLKIMKREVLEVIMPLILIKRYAFDLELCFLAQKHGFRTVEAPIFLHFQVSTGSGINIKAIRGMFLDVLAIRYRYTFKHFYQKEFWKSKHWKNGDNGGN
jgi:glycosyltransferase involved in cell wall biosynthesis